jgi:uncharacterized protein (TIGR02246 family)
MQPEVESVRSSNQRFYEALSSQNLLLMEDVWSHAPYVRCIHPGWNMLEGWQAIRDSWRSIFTQAICLTVEPLDAQVTVVGHAAIVTCREKITSFTLEGSSRSTAEATNLFEKRDGRWQLIHHHASPILSAEEAGESE